MLLVSYTEYIPQPIVQVTCMLESSVLSKAIRTLSLANRIYIYIYIYIYNDTLGSNQKLINGNI